jgi:hypothetical protein
MILLQRYSSVGQESRHPVGIVVNDRHMAEVLTAWGYKKLTDKTWGRFEGRSPLFIDWIEVKPLSRLDPEFINPLS